MPRALFTGPGKAPDADLVVSVPSEMISEISNEGSRKARQGAREPRGVCYGSMLCCDPVTVERGPGSVLCRL